MIKKVNAFFKGKKTYIAGGIAIILGLYSKDKELIMLGLVSLGLRNAIQ